MPRGSIPRCLQRGIDSHEIKKAFHLRLQITQRRKTNCPTRYHSDFMNDFTHFTDTDASSYILPFVTAGSRLHLLSSRIRRGRFWTAAPRRVPDILSAASHQPTALCIRVRMYYSSSTHLLIPLKNIIAKTHVIVKQEFFIYTTNA